MARAQQRYEGDHPHGSGSESADVPRSRETTEPWRALKPSLAIDFVPASGDTWAPEDLSGYMRADILSALEARWAAHLASAQMTMTIFDFAHDAIQLDKSLAIAVPAESGSKRALLRKFISTDIAYSRHSKPILDVLDWLDRSAKDLNFFTSSFIQVRVEEPGKVVLMFEHLGQKLKLSTDEVRVRACEVCAVLVNARDVLLGARREVERL